MAQLQGKVALVTGSSRGIGAAIAKRLAHDGASVVVNYGRDKNGADSVADDIRRAGGRATAVQADVADVAAASRLVTASLEAFGRLDIVVNNAGVAALSGLDETTQQQYEQVFGVNVRGPLFLTIAAARHMTNGGRIINVSSVAATHVTSGSGIYSASKAALEALTKAHAVALGGRDITVNAVAPGMTETEMLAKNIPEDVRKQAVKDTPLHRVGTPKDIADVVAFLASDDARWVTGSVIVTAGGRGMR